MSAQLEDQAFRDRARDFALSQLAPMFAEFQGRLGNGLRFDHDAVYTLRRHLAEALRDFIYQTPVASVSAEFAELTRGLEHWVENRKMQVDSERKFLEEAGLCAQPMKGE